MVKNRTEILDEDGAEDSCVKKSIDVFGGMLGVWKGGGKGGGVREGGKKKVN